MSALKATINAPTPAHYEHVPLAGEIPGRRCSIPGYRNFTVYVPRISNSKMTAMQRSSVCLDETVISVALAGVGIERMRQIVKAAALDYGPKHVGDGRMTRSRTVMHALMQACTQP